MAKTLICAALAAAFAAAPAAAQDGGIKERAAAAIAAAQAQQQAQQPQQPPQSSTAPFTRPGPGERQAPPVKRKSLRELANSLSAPEDLGKAVTTLRVIDGTADGKTAYKFKIPKGVTWRVLWEFKSTNPDPEKHGKLTLRVDSPQYKDFYQEFVKEVGPDEDPFGSINVCERGEGDFTLTVTSLSTKWHVEVQQLK